MGLSWESLLQHFSWIQKRFSSLLVVVFLLFIVFLQNNKTTKKLVTGADHFGVY